MCESKIKTISDTCIHQIKRKIEERGSECELELITATHQVRLTHASTSKLHVGSLTYYCIHDLLCMLPSIKVHKSTH